MVQVVQQHYIIGYGSLMNTASRQRTGETGRAYPCRVRGVCRAWGHRSTAAMTSLAVVKVDDRERFINAVFVACLETELPDFDRRECGYQRVCIDARDVEFDHTPFASSCVPSQFWIYVQSKFCAPTPEKPICLSYVDVVLAGALEFGEAFAIEFINTTGLWRHLTNDRKSPVYIRHDSSIVTISIDHLLQHVKSEDQPI